MNEPWLGNEVKLALILNRRTFHDIENRNTRDSIIPFKKQGNYPNADRSTQAVSNQLCQTSMRSHKRNEVSGHTKSDGLAAGSGNAVVKRPTQSLTNVNMSRFASTSGVWHPGVGTVFPVNG